MKKILLLVIIAVCCFAGESQAQFSRYIVRLKDKGTSPYTIANPSQYLTARAIQRRTRYGIAIDSADLPITPRYIDSIRLAGAVTILNTSKWLNQVAIQTTDANALNKINSFPFVISADPIATIAHPGEGGLTKPLEAADAVSSLPNNHNPQNATDYYSYGQSYGQVHLHNGEFLHNRGFRGDGMQMAILDAGFYHYLSLPTFDSIRNNNQVLGTWDFVAGNASVDEDHTHGMNCLSTIAANMPGIFMGTAPKTSFYLYRTEDAATEYPIEEQNWAAGAERADSLGVDVCSVSLGYFQFDNAIFNHTYADMNGDNTMIARAADMAAKKGMLVVVAAGNEGNSAWHYIITPADADSVMAVGAVTTTGVVGSFSSYGPSSDGQIKPSVAAVGVSATIANPVTGLPTSGNGTSFACPNMAGLSTCLWQAFPEVNNMSIINNLQQAANRFTNPDNRTGYGIPDMKKAFVQLIKQLFTKQITLNTCVANLQWTVKTDSVMTVSVERRLQSEVNYTTLTTKTSTGGFVSHNFNYLDDLTAVPNGVIWYRLKMTIASDTTFFLDSTSINHTQNCTPQPVLTVTAVSSFGPLCVGTTSPAASFTVSGTNLPVANVNVGPLSGYSFATTINGTYTASLSLPQPGGAYSQVVYVKFSPVTSNSYNGAIPVSCGSTATSLSVSGSGINTIPSVLTIGSSNLSTHGVTLAGQVTSTGCSALSQYGIEYSTVNGFPNGTGISVAATNISGGSYNISRTALAPGTTYYYRAYATNNGGTAYGNLMSFTTDALPDGLTIYNSPVANGTLLHYSINGIIPGKYGVRIINRLGQVVYQKEMDVTVNYIDDSFMLPVFLSTGVYTLQLISSSLKYQEKQSFIIH